MTLQPFYIYGFPNTGHCTSRVWCPTGHNKEWGDIGPYSIDVAELMRDNFRVRSGHFRSFMPNHLVCLRVSS